MTTPPQPPDSVGDTRVGGPGDEAGTDAETRTMSADPPRGFDADAEATVQIPPVAGPPTPAVLVTADDVRRGKPDPEGYLAAAAGLGAEAGSAIVVEDSPDGIRAARAAAVSSVLGVGERAQDAGPDALVRDLVAVSWNGQGLSIG